MEKRILVVDDEMDLCEILQFNLETEGYIVDKAYSAEEALTQDISSYDLLLLDIMMGEISGYQMAKLLKENPKTKHIPIIFLTARDSENDLLTGFNIGAEDYIVKPFSLKEVAVRVKAVLRRSTQTSTEEPQTKYEGLVVKTDGKKVLLDDEEVAVTRKEFEILSLLLSDTNHVFSRDEILSKIWGNNVVVLDRTIDVNITRLRKKIGRYGKNIVTRQGYGYIFED